VREDTRLLRFLLVVGLASAGLVLPAAARAGTVAIFYYPWYGTPARDGAWEHWSQNGHRPPRDVYSRFFPALGPYSSSSRSVVDRQMAEIASAGVDEVVVSWWGRMSDEDLRLPLVLSLAHAHNLQVAIHLEPYEGRSPETVSADLWYIAALGVRDVYVYQPQDFAASDWAEVRATVPFMLHLFGGTARVGFAAAARFDGLYTYDFVNYSGATFARLCAQARTLHLLCAPSVGPGFDGRRAGEPLDRPRRNGATYDVLWTAALAAGPDIVTVTSYNEWGEGTQIEPAAARPGYCGYDRAWGLSGIAAQNAYLTRTAYWAARFHGLSWSHSIRP
jgi:glycoprotein endo-alpha-1,2-mannosidase